MDDLLQKARASLRSAEHLLSNTYPSLKEPKILLTVLSHIRKGYGYALRSALAEKRRTADDFRTAMNLFRILCSKEYGISVEQLTRLEEIDDLHNAHRDAPVEFSKGKHFVICDEEYGTTMLGADGLAAQIRDANVFIDRIASKTPQ